MVGVDFNLKTRVEVEEELKQVTAFAGEHDDREITQVIGATYQQFETAPIRDFVPILVERYTREELSTTT